MKQKLNHEFTVDDQTLKMNSIPETPILAKPIYPTKHQFMLENNSERVSKNKTEIKGRNFFSYSKLLPQRKTPFTQQITN